MNRFSLDLLSSLKDKYCKVAYDDLLAQNMVCFLEDSIVRKMAEKQLEYSRKILVTVTMNDDGHVKISPSDFYSGLLLAGMWCPYRDIENFHILNYEYTEKYSWDNGTLNLEKGDFTNTTGNFLVISRDWDLRELVETKLKKDYLQKLTDFLED